MTESVSYTAFFPLAAQAAQYFFARATKEDHQVMAAYQVPVAPQMPQMQMPAMPQMMPPTIPAMQMPPMPTMPTLPWQSGGPQMPFAQAPQMPSTQSPFLSPQSVQTHVMTRMVAEEPPEAPVPAPEGGFSASDSYAATYNTSVACLPCSRGHVAAIDVGADEATAAMESGDMDGVRRNLARIAAEAFVMKRYDWTAEKLARAPASDRAVIEQLMPQIDALLAETPHAPEQVVTAWAAVDESLRFTRSTHPTDKDRAEVMERVQDAERLANYAEREVLAPQNLKGVAVGQKDARRALTHLRDGRHGITEMETVDAAALEEVAAQFASATYALTPEPDERQVERVAARSRAISEQLDAMVKARMLGRPIIPQEATA